jgi:hypothetical protein
MRQLPSVAATVLALLLVGAGVGSVTALDTGATDALAEQHVVNTQITDRVVDGADRADRSRIFETRIAGIGGADWSEDLDAFLTVFDLDEETQAAIVDEAEEMRADGATAADVHHMVHYRLYQHGHDTRDVHAYAVAYRLGEGFDLTDEQMTELATGIVDELDDGADRREIRQYTREKLEAFGVTDEEMRSAVVEHRLHTLADRHDLTDEQTEELVHGALELVDSGASRAELREYVHETLEEFGVDLDDRRERGERRDRDSERGRDSHSDGTDDADA